jgi:hypothetical protein
MTLILLLVATSAFAAEVENPRAVSIDQDGETQLIGDDSDNEIVIQFGDPDDLITGNRGIGVTGSIMGLSVTASLPTDVEGSYLFLTLSQVLFFVR